MRIRGNQPHVREQGSWPPAERTAEAAQDGGVGRQRVRAAQLVQLEQVLGLAQEPVRLPEVLGVGAADVALVGQGGQGGERGGDAEPLVGPAVHELQQLDGELDVAQAPGAELELAARHVLGQRVDDPAAHRLHVLDEVLPL